MNVRLKTGEGVPLHGHICCKCEQFKQCLQGVRKVGNEPSQIIFSCPECLDKERDEYEARLATVEN